MMNPQRMLVFLAVAKNLSYTKAAEELYISQPAVSNHVKALENELGTRLFNRSANSIQLTNAGKITVEYAVKLERLLKDLQYDVNKIQEALAGSLRIGASSTISQYVIPSVITAFSDKYPDVSLSLLSGNSQQIHQQLQDDQIDIGIVEGTKKLTIFSYAPFISDEIGLISHKNNAVLSNHISLQRLTAVPLILRERGSGTREVFEKALHELGLNLDEMNIKMILGSTESIKSYLQYTSAVGIFSWAAIRENERSTYCISRIGGKPIMRDYQFIQKQGACLKLARHFIRFAQNKIS
jgi:DNA-binding transcriptional LysR family regulator